MDSNNIAENLRDKFKQECDECFNLAEKEIRKLFDEIGLKNRCNQGYLFEQLRSTPNRNKFMTYYFNSGPVTLITEKGLGSSWFYECVSYSHKLGMELIKLSTDLQSTIECDEI